MSLPLDPLFLRRQIDQVLTRYRLHSPAAVELLLGTCAVESNFGMYRRQRGDGPARGIMQIEPATLADLHRNYVAARPGLAATIRDEFGTSGPSPYLCEHVDDYCILFARLKYRTIPKPLPDAGDIPAQAAYWKKWYNTPLGKGTVEKYLEKYQRYVLGVS